MEEQKGWTRASYKAMWKALGGTHTKCIRKMKGKVKEPGAFCNWLGQKAGKKPHGKKKVARESKQPMEPVQMRLINILIEAYDRRKITKAKAKKMWKKLAPDNKLSQCIQKLKGKKGIDNPAALCQWIKKKAGAKHEQRETVLGFTKAEIDDLQTRANIKMEDLIKLEEEIRHLVGPDFSKIVENQEVKKIMYRYLEAGYKGSQLLHMIRKEIYEQYT